MDPKSTSTPKPFPRKRTSIHDVVVSPPSNIEYDTQQSLNSSSGKQYDDYDAGDQNVSSDENVDFKENECLNRNENIRTPCDANKPASYNKTYPVDGVCSGKLLIICFGIGLVGMMYLYFVIDDENLPIVLTIDDIKTQFPLQDKEIWIYLKSGIEEIETRNKPAVYIFLYEKDNEIILDKFLENVTVYASCIVNKDCQIKPITLRSKQLNSPQLIRDYGLVIERYRSLLEEKHIMIIKNIDEMHSNVAQAFHAFCDEYTPPISKSLFLFTVKVDKFEGEPLRQVLSILRNKWSALKSDTLEPLLTRISSTVLRVSKESNII